MRAAPAPGPRENPRPGGGALPKLDGMESTPKESWSSGDAYERWVGRWSRLVAPRFLDLLQVPRQAAWADVGCGTGALSASILARRDPARLVGIDKAPAYVEAARAQVNDPRATFVTGDAQALPWEARSVDAAVSGLVLNFVPEPPRMAAEMVRITRPGGMVAAYVWDYGGGMEMMRHFWDVALEQNPGDARLDQAERFPICAPQPLADLWRGCGLQDVVAEAIAIPMQFRDFDDFWTPFLGKQGSAPTYLASLPQEKQDAIREALRRRVAPASGPFELAGKAWAVRGRVPA